MSNVIAFVVVAYLAVTIGCIILVVGVRFVAQVLSSLFKEKGE